MSQWWLVMAAAAAAAAVVMVVVSVVVVVLLLVLEGVGATAAGSAAMRRSLTWKVYFGACRCVRRAR